MRAAKGRRWHGTALTVQASHLRPSSQQPVQPEPASGSARIGLTLTRKVGCAVVRNRARRRLREAVRLSPDLPVEPGRDYVIIGRVAALRLPFDQLKNELAQAIRGATRADDKASKSRSKPPSVQPRLQRSRPEP